MPVALSYAARMIANAERLRLWIGPVVAVVTILGTGIGGYYAAQSKIFETIEEIGRESKGMVADVRYEIMGTTKDVQSSVELLNHSVQTLSASVRELDTKTEKIRDEMPKGVVPELRAAVAEHDRRLDRIEVEVVRLATQVETAAKREDSRP